MEINLASEMLQLEVARGRARMSTIASVANKRIYATRVQLGIPDILTHTVNVVVKNDVNIALVTNASRDINRLLDTELSGLKVRVSMDIEIRNMLDDVRANLAELIRILGDGRDPEQKTPVYIPGLENPNGTASIVPTVISISAIITSIVGIAVVCAIFSKD